MINTTGNKEQTGKTNQKVQPRGNLRVEHQEEYQLQDRAEAEEFSTHFWGSMSEKSENTCHHEVLKHRETSLQNLETEGAETTVRAEKKEAEHIRRSQRRTEQEAEHVSRTH